MAPSTREIPAGKILLAECGDVDETNRAQTEILERVLVGNRCYLLVHSSPGFELAGSCMRWTNGYYAVRFMATNAWHGRQFKTEQEAREMLEVWVARRLEQES